MPVKYMLYGLRTLYKYLPLASSASFCEVHCIDYHALPLSWVDGDHHMDANDEDNKGGGAELLMMITVVRGFADMIFVTSSTSRASVKYFWI